MSLIQKFSFLCIFALVSFGFVFGWIVTKALEANMIAHARADSANFIRKEMATAFRPEELIEAAEKPGHEPFAKKMEQLALNIHYARIKVWNKNAQIIWSDDARLIGQSFSENDEFVKAMKGEVVSEIKVPHKDEHVFEKQFGTIMELYVPLTLGEQRPNDIIGAIEVYENLDLIYIDIRQNNRVIWIAVGTGFTLLYLFLFGIVWRASTTMKQQTQSLIQSKEQLIQADKMVSLGTLSAGIAHEVNNPNQHILSNFQLIDKLFISIDPVLQKHCFENGDFEVNGIPFSEVREKIPEMLSAIRNGSDRISRIVKDLGDFARYRPEEHISGLQLNEVVESAERLVTPMLKKSTRFFVKNLDKNLPTIRGNFQRLEQVVINLIINACQALPDPSKKIEVGTSFDPKKKYVVLTFQDEGIGIGKEDHKRLFDPFFTTRRDDGGTGLGLSISSSIIETHKGTIRCESELGNGTCFTVRLPLTSGKSRSVAKG